MKSNVKYTICIDALSILCQGKITLFTNDESQNDSLIFSGKQIQFKSNFTSCHPAFNYCLNIFIDDRIFGHLFYGNNFKYRFEKADTSLLSIENHILYQSGLSEKLTIILKTLGLNFQKYNTMEIAIDGAGIIAKHTILTYNKKIRRKIKLRIKPELNDVTKENIGYILGSKKSEKHISLYQKSQEIEKSQKTYITDFWERNNLFNFEKQIDRCELRLSTKSLKNFSKDFSQLENPAYLASYFKQSAQRYLEFISNSEKNIVYSVVNWNQFEQTKIIKLTKTNRANNLNRYRSTLRNLFEEYIVTHDELYLRTFADLGARYKFTNWIIRSAPRWIRDFRLLT